MEQKDEHYESKFEFPFWKLIKQRAEEKDISYAEAATEVFPEYGKNIRFRDEEFENAAVRKRKQELDKLEQEAKAKKK